MIQNELPPEVVAPEGVTPEQRQAMNADRLDKAQSFVVSENKVKAKMSDKDRERYEELTTQGMEASEKEGFNLSEYHESADFLERTAIKDKYDSEKPIELDSLQARLFKMTEGQQLQYLKDKKLVSDYRKKTGRFKLAGEPAREAINANVRMQELDNEYELEEGDRQKIPKDISYPEQRKLKMTENELLQYLEDMKLLNSSSARSKLAPKEGTELRAAKDRVEAIKRKYPTTGLEVAEDEEEAA